MLERTYAYRLYPNKAEQKRFEIIADTSRALYNQMLKNRTEHYHKTCIWKHLDPTPFIRKSLLMKDLDKSVIRLTVNRLEQAYKRFFYVQNTQLDRYRPEALQRAEIEPGYQLTDTDLIGYPKIKPRNSKESWDIGAAAIKIVQNRAYIPGMGAVKMKLHRPIPKDAQIMYYTVLKKSSGHFYLLVHLQVPEVPPKEQLDKAIGIVLVPGALAQTSCGCPVQFRHISTGKEQRIESEYLKLTRRTPGSNRYEKQRMKLAKLYEKRTNQRRDSLHKEANKILEKADIIVVEEAAVMRKKRELIRMGALHAVQDEAWWTFTKYLKYKSQDAGKLFWRAPMALPVWNTCSVCGVISVKEKRQTSWVCPVCGIVMPTEINAARILERFGHQVINEWNALKRQ